MSRSFRNRRFHGKGGFTSFVGYTSNKEDKVLANKRLRHRNNQILRDIHDIDKLVEDKFPLMTLREVSDVWDFASDGLQHYKDYNGSRYGWRWSEEDIRRNNRK